MRIDTGYQPKYTVCVDYYRCECHCQKSVFFGMDIDTIPWEGCACFLSKRRWDKPKKKRKSKWPTMAEFEFGV